MSLEQAGGGGKTFPVENHCSSIKVRLQEVRTSILRIQVINMNSIYVAQDDYICH